MRALWSVVLVGLLLVWLCPAAAASSAASPEQDLTTANTSVQRALDAARTGDLVTAKQAYDQFENAWFEIEQGVRETSRDAYVAIEKAMRDVAVAFAATPPDANQVVTALSSLERENQAFISHQQVTPSADTATAVVPGQATKSTVITLLDLLGEARAALASNDYPTATSRLKSFEAAWLDVEGDVKVRSADDYRQTENDMALATSLAGQSSPQTAEVVDRMSTRLEPYREVQRYGVFDATIILLREGLEALLVIVALSAYLKRSANRAGQAWLWTGAAGGLLLSVVLGVAIQRFFGAIINPSNREIMEGVIGLFAAAMLIYVSYWLHSKASLSGWQKYINHQTADALRGGRLFGIAVLAFLAVFREGAETALFYLGMASNISNADLFLGLGLGALVLATIGFLMVIVGLRIPMRPFFAVASLLVFYLCFKFVGTGIHALQVAGIIPSGSATYLPTVDLIGLYPTWPTTLAQVMLLAAGVWVVLRDRIGRAPGSTAAMSSALLLLIWVACNTVVPASAPTAAPVKLALPTAPALTSGRKEAAFVAGPRRRLEEMLTALQNNDVPAARGHYDRVAAANARHNADGPASTGDAWPV